MVLIISCVTVHDVSSHLRLPFAKYKLRKEQNQNWLPLIFAAEVDPLTWAQWYTRRQLQMTKLLPLWRCGLDTPVTLLPVVLSSLQWLNRASFFSKNLNVPKITRGKKPSGAFSWPTSRICIQAEILPPSWPMVTLCVGDNLTVVNAPLCHAGCAALLFPFLSRVEVACRGEAGMELSDG